MNCEYKIDEYCHNNYDKWKNVIYCTKENCSLYEDMPEEVKSKSVRKRENIQRGIHGDRRDNTYLTGLAVSNSGEVINQPESNNDEITIEFGDNQRIEKLLYNTLKDENKAIYYAGYRTATQKAIKKYSSLTDKYCNMVEQFIEIKEQKRYMIGEIENAVNEFSPEDSLNVISELIGKWSNKE